MKKTVLITGTSSGIGRATAKYFHKKGWNVIATMRVPAGEAEWQNLTGMMVARLDVEDADSIAQAVNTGLAEFGKIDALVNNAGYGQYGLFESLSREKVHKQFGVNVFGVMDMTRALLPHFRQNKGGLIINVSSGAGLFTLPMASLYCASKFALEGFSEALSYELASQNIVVKIVEPHGGVTETNFTERAANEQGQDISLSDYKPFAEQMSVANARMTAARTTTSGEVAKVIYEAATDGTDQLRYLVGNDSRGFLKARMEMPEAKYVAFMRGHFKENGEAQKKPTVRKK